jgi:transposase InsO family protein
MSKARLVITAVVVEHRPVAEVARDYRVARSWVYELLARYRLEGEAAFQARSRRPRSSPNATSPEATELVLALRKHLADAGHDAGAETISWHLKHHHNLAVSRTTIHRILIRHGLVVGQPAKRPKSSYLRFAAEQPNETWQSDFTHYRLAGGEDTEILTWLDDHSRYALDITAHRRVSGPIVLARFRQTGSTHGFPASVLTDNGMVFTTRHSGGKGGRNHLEYELRARNIVQKNGRPNHPTTQGKVERFQQTMKKWLRAQTPQPVTIAELQTLLTQFQHQYNHHRPHRSLEHRATPATAYQARPKATPSTDRSSDTHTRIRADKIDRVGTVTLRVAGRLRHIGVGRTYAGTDILMLIEDLHVRIINAATGELLRELIIDPRRDYQGTGRPPGPTRK